MCGGSILNSDGTPESFAVRFLFIKYIKEVIANESTELNETQHVLLNWGREEKIDEKIDIENIKKSIKEKPESFKKFIEQKEKEFLELKSKIKLQLESKRELSLYGQRQFSLDAQIQIDEFEFVKLIENIKKLNDYINMQNELTNMEKEILKTKFDAFFDSTKTQYDELKTKFDDIFLSKSQTEFITNERKHIKVLKSLYKLLLIQSEKVKIHFVNQ